ncbi:asparagine synthase (glutamine-hydrolyzing) [Pseudodesulfovibrio cashew]|uniref:asparagine synthase (glutamine-hydrolyzing) n=1 Tax=Pseudodesulfovibrio cashew TaxID=2678688 RepID=A0A6I6J953_9BACT|nr:asparagine synthase (glutamine-hydrolyzing) [Pseudodesulfovibrio cashew]QGY39356.1 asparagine synthase (glutamine-hydrolyzing) [Pseudodesulfovibrio cashew]
MCGIFGVFPRRGGEVGAGVLERMSSALLSRGPDHAGYHREPGFGMGMDRLAILDPAKGNQPIYSADGRYCIVYNGEIYNHLELRPELERAGYVFRTGCDTETVLNAFLHHGEACLGLFNGMFAFAVWDSLKRRLFLARDSFGIKPFYYAETEDAFCFASQPKALLGLAGPVRPGWVAIGRYFRLGYVPSPDCAFQGMAKIPAGHFAWVEEKTVSLKRYFQPEYGGGPALSEGELVHTLEEKLEQAVNRELLSDVPIGLFLSGGLDSSAVAAHAARLSSGGIRSYALKFSEGTHDESADAALVARHLGLEHREIPMSGALLMDAFEAVGKALDEPFADSTVLPLYVISKAAAREIKAVLTGWGGDEIFAGYPTYKAHHLARYYRMLPGFIGNGLLPAAVNRLPVSEKYMSFEFKAKRFVRGMDLTPLEQHAVWMEYFSRDELAGLFREEPYGEMAAVDVLMEDAIRAMPSGETLDNVLALDARFFLEGNGLFQADRVTMMASLEGRVPLLNTDLVKWVNAIPAGRKMPRGKLKHLLKKAMEGRLPESILNKPKKGFGPPTSAWIRGELADVVEALFEPDKIEAQGVFHGGTIRRLLKEHREFRRDHGRKIWALAGFQVWYDNFVANGAA